MELRHLRYFVSVAETASVSKAALRIHISQPALSRQIRDLEAELGVRLFDRLGRRIRLTAEGQEFLGRSRDVLARADAMGERARALTTGAAGHLRVGTTPQTMQSVIAAFLAQYRRVRPGVEVSLVEAGGVRLLDLLANGGLQIAVGGILAGARYGSRLLFPMHLLAVAAADRRWKKRSTIEVAELAHEPLLLLDRDFGTRQLFDAACRMAHLQPHVVLESTEAHSLVALAEAGQGIAGVPSTVRFMSKRIRVMPIVQEGSRSARGARSCGICAGPFRSTGRLSWTNWKRTRGAIFRASGSARSRRHCHRRRTGSVRPHHRPGAPGTAPDAEPAYRTAASPARSRPSGC